MKDDFYKKLAEKNKPEDPAIGNLENNSYYDIDMLNKANAPILKEIEEWKEKQKKSNWIGKWYMQTQIDKLKKKLHHYQ